MSRSNGKHSQLSSTARGLRRLTMVIPLLIAAVVAGFIVFNDRTVTIESPSNPGESDVTMASEDINVEVSPDPPAPASAPQRREQRIALEERKLNAKRAEVRRLKLARDAEQAALPSTFRVATFNVLGASHTDAGGNKPGWASGAARMGWTVAALNNYGVDVVGFQEFESSQAGQFAGMTGGAFAMYPGNALGPRSVRFTIAWRTEEWTAVETTTVGIPYAGGNYIDMPVVRLRRNDTGREVYFINVHNPASTGRLGNNARWRAVATGIETALINRLRSETGLPVIITGDFNEREGIFCPMVQNTDMASASGGSVGAGVCQPPPAMHVDWIFGTSSLITWANYTQSGTGTAGRVSDHDLVFADATVAGDEPAPETEEGE